MDRTGRRKIQEVFRRSKDKCKICRKTISVVRKKPNGHVFLDLGPVDSIINSECQRHKQVMELISEELKFHEQKKQLTIHHDYFSRSFCFIHQNGNTAESIFYNQSPYFDLVAGQDRAESFVYGVQLDPEWIDSNKLLQWYESCIKDHGDKCSNPPYLAQLPEPKPTLFVDTANDCLVHAPKLSSYVALSYVWGQVGMVKTFAANLNEMQKPGALKEPSIRSKLPRTIKQAIRLVRLMNERYLWVDSLCIIQDDAGVMNSHLDRMSSIFAHASFVIVAVDGADAEYGLRGLRETPEAKPRCMKQEVIPFGDWRFQKRHLMSGTEGSAQLPGFTYYDRGWTFQEYMFSRRRICFENNSVRFQCCKSTCYEDHRHPELPDHTRDFMLNNKYPSLTVYSRIVDDFNRRQLTYPQDCLDAFAGTLSCYNEIFAGGFICGLPQMFFDVALLWQPEAELVRRVPKFADGKPQTKDVCLPSWSWLGWNGAIDFDGWSPGNDFVAACSGWISMTDNRTFPITTWYVGTEPDTAERQQVNVQWAAWREKYKDPKAKLPPGWKKRKRGSQTLTNEDPPDGYGDCLYEHGSCRATCWYPIPLSDPGSQSSIKTDARYLFGLVQTARLYTTGAVFTPPRHVPGRSEIRCNSYVSLYTSRKEWAGILRLRKRDQIEGHAEASGGALRGLELIALSRGLISNAVQNAHDVEEFKMEERPKQGKNYEYYNVMWIRWEDGVAYREGLGRVWKDAWDSLEPPTIDVVLG